MSPEAPQRRRAEGSDPVGGADDLSADGRQTGAYAPRCDLCDGPMRETHCKLLCDRCGYVRDCSDP